MNWKKHFNFIGHMGHTNHKKKHRLYFVFFCVIIIHHSSFIIQVFGSSSVGGIRERTISAAHVAILVVVVAARVTHQRESSRKTRVAREVGAVVKSSITRHTNPILVLIAFCHALFLRKLEPGYMGLCRLHSRRTRAGGTGSGSPVASSSIRCSHRSSFVRL
jgi:hypothetical protein